MQRIGLKWAMQEGIGKSVMGHTTDPFRQRAKQRTLKFPEVQSDDVMSVEHLALVYLADAWQNGTRE